MEIVEGGLVPQRQHITESIMAASIFHKESKGFGYNITQGLYTCGSCRPGLKSRCKKGKQANNTKHGQGCEAGSK